MKVKLLEDYYHKDNTRKYLKGEVIKTEDNPHSYFYHIWQDTTLDIIPKSICKGDDK